MSGVAWISAHEYSASCHDAQVEWSIVDLLNVLAFSSGFNGRHSHVVEGHHADWVTLLQSIVLEASSYFGNHRLNLARRKIALRIAGINVEQIGRASCRERVF